MKRILIVTYLERHLKKMLPIIKELERHDDIKLKVMLLPVDPNDKRGVILEVRAGTGGEEASLFAGELLRMYGRYAEDKGWKVSITETSETGLGGINKAVVMIEGDRVYSRLKFESGVHRVQRVPSTESAGRIHTSAATVAVMPEADFKTIQDGVNGAKPGDTVLVYGRLYHESIKFPASGEPGSG